MDKVDFKKQRKVKTTFRITQENQNIIVENAKSENCTQNYFINNLIQKASNKFVHERNFLKIVEEFVYRVCDGIEEATSMDDVCCPEDFIDLKEKIIELKEL